MHELAIVVNILEIVEEHLSREESPGEVSRIVLRVGELSGVMEEALKFNFEMAKRGTLADQAVLEINAIEGRGCCRSCLEEFKVGEFVVVCPACGSRNVEITAGQELQIKEIYLQETPATSDSN